MCFPQLLRYPIESIIHLESLIFNFGAITHKHSSPHPAEQPGDRPMALDPSQEENIASKLKETIGAAGGRSSTDKIFELLEQACAIEVGNKHLFDNTTLLREALSLVRGPNTNQEVSTPKIVSQPNGLGAVLNSADDNAGLSSKSKAIFCTGILIGTIFGGFVLKCLCFLLFMAAMIAMFWIFGSMHKSQGLRSLPM